MRLIGDPHLGREFVAHVPLDRRGDREKMMMEQFEKELNEFPDMTVIVGDLFERPIVSTHVLYQTITLILEAAARQPNRDIIVMAGNHDLDKATEKRGSFHLLAMALDLVPNVHVLFKPTIINDVAFFPWEYERTALEQVNDFQHLPSRAVGHWDLESFGADDSHLCPAKQLQRLGATNVYSGHWHVASTYTVDGVDVVCTGSMQPMTHAEDPKGTLYLTLTKAEYEAMDPKDLENKYVRVEYDEGEEVTPPPTCLAFKTRVNKSEREVERVNLGTFDLNDILKQAFDSYSVTIDKQTFVKDNLNDLN